MIFISITRVSFTRPKKKGEEKWKENFLHIGISIKVKEDGKIIKLLSHQACLALRMVGGTISYEKSIPERNLISREKKYCGIYQRHLIPQVAWQLFNSSTMWKNGWKFPEYFFLPRKFLCCEKLQECMSAWVDNHVIILLKKLFPHMFFGLHHMKTECFSFEKSQFSQAKRFDKQLGWKKYEIEWIFARQHRSGCFSGEKLSDFGLAGVWLWCKWVPRTE